jgi:hypothetical protein
MGGGGALAAAAARPSLQAALPIAPWTDATVRDGIAVPTMIITGTPDGLPIYHGITQPEKAYLELSDASPLFPLSPHTLLGKFAVVWLKRFVDNDIRYERFLCPGPSGPEIAVYRATCPMVT